MFKRKRLIFVFVTIFLSGIFLLGVFAVNSLQQNYVAPILMYHSVNPKHERKNKLVVSPATFQRQMRFLKRHHFNVLPLEVVADLIREKKKIPPRTLALAFDDGYRDNYTYAFPILKKYNFPAAMFVIVNEIGRPRGDRLTWDEIKIMQDSGIIVFGSHALDPEPLVNIKSEVELRKQIFGSKKILEDKLKRPVNMFSYASGLFNPKVRQLVIDAGYKLAVSTSPGVKYPNDDLFALKRVRISENARNLLVFWIKTSGFYTFIKEHRDKD